MILCLFCTRESCVQKQRDETDVSLYSKCIVMNVVNVVNDDTQHVQHIEHAQ